MYIAPNCEIYLCDDIPLNNRYENTIYFQYEQDQIDYFRTKIYRQFTNQMYSRHTRNSLRLKMPMDKIKQCNYLFFRNYSKGLTPPLDDTFENKWYYCFITDYEYVNNEVTEIFYEIDVIQTFMFDFTFGQNFVVRETPETDVIYANHELESMSLGDGFVVNSGTRVTSASGTDSNLYDMNFWRIGVLVSEEKSGNNWVQPTPVVINNILTPCGFHTFTESASDVAALKTFLQDYIDAGKADAILNIYMFPNDLYVENSGVFSVAEQTMTFQANETTIDGYTPKNNKVFSDQFNFLIVSNNSGSTIKLSFSDWYTGHIGEMTMKGSFLTEPSCLLYPRNYRRKTNDYESGIVLDNFPEVAFLSDVYKAWWAQHKSSIFMSAFKGELSDISSSVETAENAAATAAGATVNAQTYATTNSANRHASQSAVMSSLHGGGNGGVLAGAFKPSNVENLVLDTWAQAKDLQVIPPQVHGQVKLNSLNAGMNRTGFYFYQVCVKHDIAKRIDDFFTMFGYATNQLKDVNLKQRPHFTYIRLSTFNLLHNRIPNAYFDQIASIYNNGIRFWVNPAEVGDFTVDNRPST